MESIQSNLEKNIIAELTRSEFKAYGKVTGSDSVDLAWEQTSGSMEQTNSIWAPDLDSYQNNSGKQKRKSFNKWF